MPWSLWSSTSVWSGFGCACVSAVQKHHGGRPPLRTAAFWILLNGSLGITPSAWCPGPFQVSRSVSSLPSLVDRKVSCPSAAWKCRGRRCWEREAACLVLALQREVDGVWRGPACRGLNTRGHGRSSALCSAASALSLGLASAGSCGVSLLQGGWSCLLAPGFAFCSSARESFAKRLCGAFLCCCG